ncbi:ZIP zinc transporter-domain-containing protein [Globomyces pollinis-pini]|nr:ZIP zinc transporter-domain-containing protein [Globomyces pollinis-pini]
MNSLVVATLLTSVLAGAGHDHGGHDHGGHDHGLVDCEAMELEEYTLQTHIYGVFIILAVSALGIFGSIWLGTKKSKNITTTLQLVKMFGIGIIAGTAWIHLLPHAFLKFSSPCLPESMSRYGISFVGLFGLIAAFLVQLLEVSSSRHNHSSHAHEEHVLPIEEKESPELTHIQHSSIIGTYVLEFGILSHSLIIGLALGVCPDDEYTTLLIAVAFHQLFEGLALGSLIATTVLSLTTKIYLGLLYPLTTPLGVVIGILVRESFNQNAAAAIVIQGTLDSLSSGILIYTTYCSLMGAEINHHSGFKGYSPMFKVACFLMMYVGASAMAILALWA